MTELTIEALGRKGDGKAAGNIIVDRALPGERVSGAVVIGRMSAPKILDPSSDRVSAPCRFFKSCGGCQLQHASDPFVADWKQSVVQDALLKHGLSPQFRSVETSPTRSRRRAKLAARRTKSGALAGFHARASGTIVDIADCPVLNEELNTAFALCRKMARIGGSRAGVLECLCTATDAGLIVNVTGGKPLDADLRQDLPREVAPFAVARLTWDGELVLQNTVPTVRLGRTRVNLPDSAFLQATQHGEDVLQSAVREALEAAEGVADLFAGCGTFALSLADYAPVSAFEGDPNMVAACQHAANHGALTFPVTAAVRDLFQDPLDASELARFDGLVLDPPRAGAARQVDQIARSDVAVVAYVSCDPGTFARDADVLIKAGYQLDWVQVVDQFRWSSHVELVARFSRPA